MRSCAPHARPGSATAPAPPGLGIHAALWALRAYQAVVSPWLGPACRYAPTCSQYAAEAVEHHGLARGAWLALRRLTRCHPFGGCGYDPVP